MPLAWIKAANYIGMLWTSHVNAGQAGGRSSPAAGV